MVRDRPASHLATLAGQAGQVAELEGQLHRQAQVAAGRIAAEQAADGPQPVGQRVGVDVEAPGGLVGVVIGLHVGPERRDQLGAAFGIVAVQRPEGVFDEVAPVLRSAAVEQDPLDAEVLKGQRPVGDAEPAGRLQGLVGLVQAVAQLSYGAHR